MSKPVGPYSPIMRAGDLLLASGQIGLRDGAMVEGGLEPQLRRLMANLRGVLETQGATLEDVVKTTVFLVDMADFAEMNRIYLEEFGDHRPARSTIGVAALPVGAVVEVEAVAYKPV